MSIVKPEKKKRKLVDLSTKLAILKHLDDVHSIKATADRFKLSKGALFNQPNRNTEILLKEAESNRSLSKARIVQQSDINVVLWRWFLTARSRGYPISGPVSLGKKASKSQLRLEPMSMNFSASEGWLQKWE
ncbi:hypothetical protein BASA60_008356 [Batrachochytrium salamandrivorans]|nr:hypothetical protein BASA60_008356 [Batrachochytrium salamandrivorans]